MCNSGYLSRSSDELPKVSGNFSQLLVFNICSITPTKNNENVCKIKECNGLV